MATATSILHISLKRGFSSIYRLSLSLARTKRSETAFLMNTHTAALELFLRDRFYLFLPSLSLSADSAGTRQCAVELPLLALNQSPYNKY